MKHEFGEVWTDPRDGQIVMVIGPNEVDLGNVNRPMCLTVGGTHLPGGIYPWTLGPNAMYFTQRVDDDQDE